MKGSSNPVVLGLVGLFILAVIVTLILRRRR